MIILYVKTVCTWFEQKAGKSKSFSIAKLQGRNADVGYKYCDFTTINNICRSLY